MFLYRRKKFIKSTISKAVLKPLASQVAAVCPTSFPLLSVVENDYWDLCGVTDKKVFVVEEYAIAF